MSIIAVDKLQCQYQNSEIAVFEDFNLNVDKGTLVTIKGSNGSGKSTLLRILGKFRTRNLVLDYNHFRVNGNPSMVIQDPGLQILSFHVVEEVAMRLSFKGISRQKRISEVDSLLHEFGAFHLRNRDPHKLSAGEQQKIVTLASIIDRPQIVLMDEPFTFLDQINLEMLKNHILDLRSQGYTIILTTHLDLLDNEADQLIFLDEMQQKSVFEAVDLTGYSPSNDRYQIDGWIGYGKKLVRINREFTRNGLFVITGRNGSGKTCLLQTLAGINEMVEGKVDSLPNAVYIPQRPSLLFSKPSVREELGGLEIPPWLEQYSEYSPFQLSVGYQKVLAVYIALHKFETCLIDEPYQSLDQYFKHMISTLFQQFYQEKLIIITTNRSLETLKIRIDGSQQLEVGDYA